MATDSRRGEDLYMLDRQERLEERRICSYSEICDGPVTGGSGGSGQVLGVVGIGGMCEGRTGKDSGRMDTGGQALE